jgi:hypothetical protein
MSIQKSFISAAGGVFIALGAFGTLPVDAALLKFSFTTDSGRIDSFTLDTNTALDPNPFLDSTGEAVEGLVYTGAISNFSVETPNFNLSNVTGDYSIVPSQPFGPLGTRSVLSLVDYPAGCVTSTEFGCSVEVSIFYSGNVSELPVLSTDPLSYVDTVTRVFSGFLVFDPVTGDILSRDRIANLQIQVVPEPGSVLGILAIGIGGAGLLLKRRMNTKGQRQGSDLRRQLFSPMSS